MRQTLVGMVMLCLVFGGFAAASTAGAAKAALCVTSGLRVREVDGGAGAGTRLLDISYENRTGHSCRTGGFPGVTLYNSHDRRLAVAARAPSRSYRQLLVKPRRRVFGIIAYGETPVPIHEKCPIATSVRIYPPDNRQAVRLRLHQAGQYCHKAVVYPLASSAQRSYGG